MPIQDARSDDYALGTSSLEDCMNPTKVGSGNGKSIPLLIMMNDNGNIVVILHEMPTTCINIQRLS